MKAVVLCVGNTIRADEGIGVRVVEALERDYCLPDGVVAIDGGTSSMEMLDDLSHLDFLLVIDAVNDGKPPGTLIRLAGDEARVKSNFVMVRESEAGPLLAIAGTYEDHVVRTAAGWRFQAREIRNDVAGDLGLKR